MDADKLVRMANQIAAFFASEPDRRLAVEGVAGHLSRFWEPRMRRELLARFDSGEIDGMADLVVEAVRTHRADLQPR
jgi:formate dehydrogenase subunit delta